AGPPLPRAGDGRGPMSAELREYGNAVRGREGARALRFRPRLRVCFGPRAEGVDLPGTAGEVEGWEAGAVELLVVLMVSFGLVELYSASTFMAQSEGLPPHFYALRQFLGLGPGVLLAALLSRTDYRRFEAVAWPLVGLAFVLLVVVVLPGTEGIAPRVNGARRWLRLGVAFQPSELAKLALIIWTAALAVKKQARLHSLRKGLLPFLVVCGTVLLPVVLQPNFSAALHLALLA